MNIKAKHIVRDHKPVHADCAYEIAAELGLKRTAPYPITVYEGSCAWCHEHGTVSDVCDYVDVGYWD
jgi:hypothetical protein